MRYLPLSDQNRAEMLGSVGVASVDDLFADIPAAAKAKAKFDLSNTMSEMEVERVLSAVAAKNLNASQAPSFLGAGNYRHHTPASLD